MAFTTSERNSTVPGLWPQSRFGLPRPTTSQTDDLGDRDRQMTRQLAVGEHRQIDVGRRQQAGQRSTQRRGAHQDHRIAAGEPFPGRGAPRRGGPRASRGRARGGPIRRPRGSRSSAALRVRGRAARRRPTGSGRRPPRSGRRARPGTRRRAPPGCAVVRRDRQGLDDPRAGRGWRPGRTSSERSTWWSVVIGTRSLPISLASSGCSERSDSTRSATCWRDSRSGA